MPERILDITGSADSHPGYPSSLVRTRSTASTCIWMPARRSGVVGESDAGKSMTGLSIMGLLPPGGNIVDGAIMFGDTDLTGLSQDELRKIRGNEIAMVFQDSLAGAQPDEVDRLPGGRAGLAAPGHEPARRALDRAEEVLNLVGIPRPSERLEDYPHQLSGGLRQRVMIAMALVCEPKVLIADEPTTALDVTIQAQILSLMDRLKEELGMAVLLITHDMGVVAGRADRINVMYAGQIVEATTTATLFDGMRHPYTQSLLASIPQLDQDTRPAVLDFSIPGLPPDLADLPDGCRFAPRCRLVHDRPLPCARCRRSTGDARKSHTLPACWHPRSTGSLPKQPVAARGAARAGEGSPPTSRAPPLLADHRSGQGVPGRQLAGPLEVPRLGQGRVRGVRHGTGRRDLRSGRRVGMRQDNARAADRGAGQARLGAVAAQRPRRRRGKIRDSGRTLRRRRRDLQMMFQDPYASLDPRMRVSAILAEPLVIQGVGSRKSRRAMIADMLKEVGLPPSAVDRFPHEFSGGQRQRIGLARALMLNPAVIVADEPVSALDVSIRSQVLNLMKRLQAEHNLTYIVISPTISAVVKYLSDRIGVMCTSAGWSRPAVSATTSTTGRRTSLHRRPARRRTDPGPSGRADLGGGGRCPGRGTAEPDQPAVGLPASVPAARARGELCAEQTPQPDESFGPGHAAACHFPLIDPVHVEGNGASPAPVTAVG